MMKQHLRKADIPLLERIDAHLWGFFSSYKHTKITDAIAHDLVMSIGPRYACGECEDCKRQGINPGSGEVTPAQVMMYQAWADAVGLGEEERKHMQHRSSREMASAWIRHIIRTT